MSEVRLVPTDLGEIFEWSDLPVICSGCGSQSPCSNPAEYMIRAQNHDCAKHDGRFFFKCHDCLEKYAEFGGRTACEYTGSVHLHLVEIKELRQ